VSANEGTALAEQMLISGSRADDLSLFLPMQVGERIPRQLCRRSEGVGIVRWEKENGH
jgi:hypothetical protein